MDLQDIDIRAQPRHTRVDSVEDVFPRETNTVHEIAVVLGGHSDGRLFALVVDAEEALAENDDSVARDRVLLECFADDFLGAAVRVDVGL